METINNNDSWLKRAKIYQIMIDRFAGWDAEYTEDELKKGFLGGNILDLTNKLDYIKSLGFDTIWLSPFFVNNGYHGYHVTNFMHVDPRFAFGKKNLSMSNFLIGNTLSEDDDKIITPADAVLIEFIKKSHDKGIKIIADFVPNHCHENHPYFKSAIQDENSKYRNWFYFNKKKNSSNFVTNTIEAVDEYFPYERFLTVNELPKLNLDFPECKEYMIKVALRWLDLGVDGFRIDHCIGPSKAFLSDLNKVVKFKFKDAIIIGECLPLIQEEFYSTILGIENKKDLEILGGNEISKEQILAIDNIFLQYEGILDGLLDFSFMFILHMFAEGKIKEDMCEILIREHYKRFENSSLILPKFLDSHDSNRILYICKNDRDLLKIVIKYLHLEYGRHDPYIWYYGTEDFFTQSAPIYAEYYGDHQTRLPMKFDFFYMRNYFKIE